MGINITNHWKDTGKPVLVKEFGIEVPVHSEIRQRLLGQFRTTNHIASFMAEMVKATGNDIRLLDAGAGDGALTFALIQELCGRREKPKKIHATLYEIDSSLITSLAQLISQCYELCEQHGIKFQAEIFNADFIKAAVPSIRDGLFGTTSQNEYNVAIVNPPYRKIRSDSEERLLLRSAGIETVNLYAAFVAIITRLLERDGELVAITPRSFANGPYFQWFRKDFLKRMSLRRLHVFDSRTAAFSDQNVLQENVIFHATKNKKKPSLILVSSSSGKPAESVSMKEMKYDDVIQPDDPDSFIHFDIKTEHIEAERALKQLPFQLSDLGIKVSTGRVVEFRAKPFLRRIAGRDALPLIHAYHFNNGFVEWPKLKANKFSAILECEQTNDLLLLSDTYVLVKRFSSKEERRRIVACVFDPEKVKAPRIGIENHLNYFHINGHGLPKNIALGLAAYLNSSLVDTYFRRFSGHTQVNATDLRKLSYPSSSKLEKIGSVIGKRMLVQDEIDSIIRQELWENQKFAIQKT